MKINECKFILMVLLVACVPETNERRGGDEATPSSQEEKNVTSSIIPLEIRHCEWRVGSSGRFEKEDDLLGSFTICQSRENENDIYIQVERPITDMQVCLNPMFSGANDYSIPIGELRCLMLESSRRIYRVEMEKEQTYASFNLNGVIVIKNDLREIDYPFDGEVLISDALGKCFSELDIHKDESYCDALVEANAYTMINFR